MFKDDAIYKNIMVAIDLSKHSDIPMKKAIKLALQYGAELNVIHVISMAIPYYSYSFSTEIQDAVYIDAKQHFVKFCEQYNIAKPQQHLLIGSPKLQIIELVEKLKIDLLIVGSDGDQHMLPATFGSTASSLVAKAQCDVLTICIHPLNNTNPKEQDYHTVTQRKKDDVIA